MTIKSSGLWCDMCNKPLFGNEEYWHCTVNGEVDCHACKKCKEEYEASKEAYETSKEER